MATVRRGQKIDTGDGVIIPAEVRATTITDEFQAWLTAVYDPQTGRYVAKKLEIQSFKDHEVTGEAIRRIKVNQLLRIATRDAVHGYLAFNLRKLGKTGPTPETLRQVALIYRLALLLGDAPTQMVAAELGVPRSTAGRWVTRARDRGLLTVVDPRASRVER